MFENDLFSYVRFLVWTIARERGACLYIPKDYVGIFHVANPSIYHDFERSTWLHTKHIIFVLLAVFHLRCLNFRIGY